MFPKIQHVVCYTYILLSLFKPWARADFFTSTATMVPLLEAHKRIIDDLGDYITKEEERIAVLKNHSELYIKEHEKAMTDIPNYLGNPLNAFTLIKRLTADLDEIYDEIKNGTENNMRHVFISREDVMLPTLEDLSGAAQALRRLQVTYQLDVQDLAEGRLYGIAYGHPMTAADCFELCKALYIMNDYENSLAWGMETLRKYEEETNKNQSFTEVEVLELIGFSHYKLGNVRTAIEWTKKLLKLDPNYPRLPVNVRSKALAFDAATLKPGVRKETEDKEAKPDMNCLAQGGLDLVKQKYEALCRGQTEIDSGVAKRLFCRYMSETHPFLRLAPIKAEQLYIDPDVFLFHGVLSDDEIQSLKVLSMPQMESANFPDEKTGKMVFLSIRVCKLAWFRDEASQVVARVSQRVADMTGLSVESAEELQVVNYGLGGHYEPHYDYHAQFKHNFTTGDRIATLLFYMSDVAQGGATVFTELGLSVFPARGAALYWRNLHPSGEGDTATRHAACPVLRGSKWVCNKWLHVAGQELINPCDLNCQEKEMARKIPSPVGT